MKMIFYSRISALKPCMTIFLSFIFISMSVAQVPQITSFDKKYTEVDNILTISGNNFGTVAGNIIVNFGAAKGEIVTITNTKLEVKVPAGTTFSSLTVTNVTSGLTGFSAMPFYLSFSGSTINSWSSQLDIQDEAGLVDLCFCDFDGDNKTDVGTASKSLNFINIWRNTSTLTSLSFDKLAISLNAPTVYVTCGDLDGDGKPDLVVTKDGTTADRIFVLRNTSTVGDISFANPIPLITTGFNARMAVIRDLNNDGKPEITLADRSTTFYIFKNTSTVGTIQFDPVMSMPMLTSSDGLDIQDLNGDGLPDLVLTPEKDKDVYIFQNQSSSGSISFKAPVKFAVPGSISMLRIGDLDNDGKPDLVISKMISTLGDNISILLNTSATSGGVIGFGTAISIITEDKPDGIDIGDLDGDGIVDIAIASVHTVNKVTVLKNTSTPGNLALIKVSIPTTTNSRKVKIGDLNGDGKPDLGFTSHSSSNISFRRNLNCFFPTLTKEETSFLCDANTITLRTPNAVGAQYTWYKDDVELTTETSSSLAVGATGRYKVTAITESASCSQTSQEMNIESVEGTAPTPSVTNNGPLCVGQNLNLRVTSISGASYKWSGPNGFSSLSQNPDINNVTEKMAGTYTVEITQGSCPAESFSTNVGITPIVSQNIQVSGPLSFCEGENVTLSITGTSGYTYQWKVNGSNIASATSTSLAATTSGNYSVVLKNGNCTVESPAVQVEAFPKPTPSFTAPEVVCIDKPIQIMNTTQYSGSATLNYSWNLGDGTTSTAKELSHTYTNPGTYTITLSIINEQNSDCSVEYSRSIQVADNITFALISDHTEVPCEGEVITLSVNGSFATYLWNTGATTSTIQVTEPGVYSLNVATAEGCTGSGEITIDFLPTPILEIGSEGDLTSIGIGESVQLLASGGLNYQWSPAEGLDDPTSPNPIATPKATTTYTVISTGENGCAVSKEITINVSNALNVTGRKLFSPNGDGIDDLWRIERIHFYPECTVSIFDRQGVKVYESKGYQNDWDGTFNGKNLNQDVYFYVIRCGSKNNDKTGSITLIR